MSELFERLTRQIKEYWSKFDRKQKNLIIGLSASIVVLLCLTVYFVTRPNMTTLYQDGSELEAAAIRKVLDENQLTYTSSSDGKVIEVSSKDLVKARDLLSEADLPSKGYTYEDAYKVSMAESDAIKKEKLKQAKENELSNTLKRIKGIDDAQVLLELPDYDRLYQANVKEAKASVLITTNSKYTNDQTASVVAILKNSVDALSDANLTVADQNGVLLYGADADNENGRLDKNLEYKLKEEQAIENKVESSLAQAFNNVDAMVSLVIDNNKKNSISEIYSNPLGPDSETGLINNIQESKQSSKNVNTGGTAPGVDANPGETQYAATSSTQGESESKKEDTKVDYLVNRQTVEEEKAVGEILFDKSSIAVMVVNYKEYDRAYLEKNKLLNGQTWEEYKDSIQPVSFNVDQQYVDIVKNATGIDNVEIMGLQKPIFIDNVGTTIPYRQYAMILAVAFLAVLLAYVIYKGTEPVEVTEIIPELSVEELLSKNIEEEVEEIQDDDGSGVRKEIERFVEEKPEAAAQLLRNWLNQDWE